MACRGVHFAITDDDLARLRSSTSDEDVMTVIEAVEERWEKDAGFLCETDKAWDAIHRCLTDGSLTFDGGSDPLRLCILGGEQLHQGDDYIVSLVTHDRLRPLVTALAAITPEFIGQRYSDLPEDYQQTKSAEDCQYTWVGFLISQSFLREPRRLADISSSLSINELHAINQGRTKRMQATARRLSVV